MSLKYYNPRTPAQRHKVGIDYLKDNIWRGSPLKLLRERLKKKAGRNHGLIASYHRGGGAKRLYRDIDFSREILDQPGLISRVVYDPNRSSCIFLIVYPKLDLLYTLAT